MTEIYTATAKISDSWSRTRATKVRISFWEDGTVRASLLYPLEGTGNSEEEAIKDLSVALKSFAERLHGDQIEVEKKGESDEKRDKTETGMGIDNP